MNLERIRDALAWAIALCATVRQQRDQPIDQHLVDAADQVETACRQIVDELDSFEEN